MRKLSWMEEIKPGDSVVFIDERLRIQKPSLLKVTGVSKKSVFCGDKRFSKWNGLMDGGNTHKYKKHLFFKPNYPKLIPTTNELVTQLQEEKLNTVEFIKTFDFDNVQLNIVRQIKSLLIQHL